MKLIVRANKENWKIMGDQLRNAWFKTRGFGFNEISNSPWFDHLQYNWISLDDDIESRLLWITNLFVWDLATNLNLFPIY